MSAAIAAAGPLRHNALTVQRSADDRCYVARFTAMACPCEALIDVDDAPLACLLAEAVAGCARRIERKFSRYRPDNIVHAINASNGRPVQVDAEAAKLLDYAAMLTQMSEGRFDITSGVLRRAWTFDGGERIPSREQVNALLELVGWSRVVWRNPVLQLSPGMQIDFGGIGKEYAVDLAVAAAAAIAPDVSCLVNFGGDAAVLRPRRNGEPWRVGVETPHAVGVADRIINLTQGALATSGDSRRFVLREGKRYSHILDARTGWPVENAPRSVTVAGATCTQAGSLTTLAMLQGPGAEAFLCASGAQFWLL
jgi:thiamine biosynthesis lipoprotein